MAWPSLSDYCEAVQNAQHSFSDPELRAGAVRTSPMGLPIPISGGFATVYQVECGPRTVAARCFQREIADQQQRYAAISQYLTAARLPYTVGFSYQPQGIRVRGQWFPILKMDWVKGDSLDTYVERNLGDSGALLRIANQFLAMVVALQQANVAHGDLQHGNILVANGGLKLIDYDGMYVPTLAGSPSHETGHRNFQHPQRGSEHFGPYLDNFSAWVIYLSLVAFSVDSTLWRRARAGDESLLFRKSDFESPDTSPVLALLTRHRDPRLQGLANLFAAAMCADPPDVPPVQAAHVASATPAVAVAGPASDWLRDHVSPGPSALVTPVPAPAVLHPTGQIDWVLDFVSPPTARKRFTSPLGLPRLSLAIAWALVAAILASGLPAAVGSALIVGVVGVMAGVLLTRYRSDPVWREKAGLLRELGQRTAVLESLHEALNSLRLRKASLHTEYGRIHGTLLQERSRLQGKEQQEVARIRTALASAIRAIDTQISDLEKPIQRVRAEASGRITELQQRLAQLGQAESNEIANALSLLQQQFVANYLRQHRIGAGMIWGIGPTLAARLATNGYAAAADITWGVVYVEGIGDAKASALMTWRSQIEARAAAAMPRALPQVQLGAIQARYQAQRTQLQQQVSSTAQSAQQHEQTIKARNAPQVQQLQGNRTTAQQRAQREIQAITQHHQQECSRVDQKEAEARENLARELKKVEDEAAETRRHVYDAQWQIAKARRALEPYDHIHWIGYVFQMLGIRAPDS